MSIVKWTFGDTADVKQTSILIIVFMKTEKGMIHFRILIKSNVYLLWMVRFTTLRVTSAAVSSA